MSIESHLGARGARKNCEASALRKRSWVDGYNNFWQRGQKLRGVGQVCWALPGIAAPPLGSLLHYSTPCRMAPAEAVPYRGGGMLRGRWRHEGRSECPGPAFPPHLQPDVTTARGEGAGVGVGTEMRDGEAASKLHTPLRVSTYAMRQPSAVGARAQVRVRLRGLRAPRSSAASSAASGVRSRLFCAPQSTALVHVGDVT